MYLTGTARPPPDDVTRSRAGRPAMTRRTFTDLRATISKLGWIARTVALDARYGSILSGTIPVAHRRRR